MKKVFRKILPLLLIIVLVMGVMPVASFAAVKAVNVNKEDALRTQINKGSSVKLTADITLGSVLVIPSNVSVSLDLNGKILDRGLQNADCTDTGSVIRVEGGATLTISDSSGNNSGTITGGAAYNGGGICNYGTLYFEGGTISGNKADGSGYGNGGGIYNSENQGSAATLHLRGGVISNNEAENGGGVYNGTGAVIVEHNEVTKKVGIKSVTTVYNVKITGNTATEEGSGIYNADALTLSGEPEIYENEKYDLYLASGKKISFAGELTNTQKISVKTQGDNPVITQDFSKYNSKKPTDIFTSADTAYVPVFSSADNAEIMLKNDSKTVLQVYENKKLTNREEYDNPSDAWGKAMSYAKDNTTLWGIFSNEESVVEITLGSDWTSGNCLYTGAKKNVVVDLNGHCIKRDGKKNKDGSVFKVGEYSWLTINDSNPNSNGYADHKGGVIADAVGDSSGGGIVVEKNANLYMNGGTIYNCRTDLHGGGIYNSGEQSLISLKNCTIDSCQTKDSGDDCHGGGIYVKNTTNLILENVLIKNCKSEDKGGGLYLRERPRNVQLKNVTFEECFANDGGGAIFIDDLKSDTEFTFEAENCSFIKNKANDDGGAVYINDDDESEYKNPTIFRDCTFTENESTDYGGAIEANDNGLVIFGGTITNNKAKGKGGGVYVEGEYDISVAGKLIIKDNDGKDNYDNLCLEENSSHKAYVYCAGLYEGSEVYISTSNNKTGFAGVKNVSEYQTKYFHADKGSLSFNKTGEKTAAMVTASLFSDGSTTALIAIGCAAVALTAAAIVIKKKKGVASDDGNEDKE